MEKLLCSLIYWSMVVSGIFWFCYLTYLGFGVNY